MTRVVGRFYDKNDEAENKQYEINAMKILASMDMLPLSWIKQTSPECWYLCYNPHGIVYWTTGILINTTVRILYVKL